MKSNHAVPIALSFPMMRLDALHVASDTSVSLASSVVVSALPSAVTLAALVPFQEVSVRAEASFPYSYVASCSPYQWLVLAQHRTQCRFSVLAHRQEPPRYALARLSAA